MPTDAVNINSVECSFLVLGSTGLAVEHAQWKKDLARYIGLRFHAASKVLVDARELAKAKRFELWQKLNSVTCEPAGKHSEKLQRCLNFARQELPLCGTCNYQPCAQQEGIMAGIKMSAKCLLQIICIQSVSENFCELK